MPVKRAKAVTATELAQQEAKASLMIDMMRAMAGRSAPGAKSPLRDRFPAAPFRPAPTPTKTLPTKKASAESFEISLDVNETFTAEFEFKIASIFMERDVAQFKLLNSNTIQVEAPAPGKRKLTIKDETRKFKVTYDITVE